MKLKMKNTPLTRFLVRWLVSTLGLWLAAELLSKSISFQNGAHAIILAGLVLAIINTIVKPVLILFSLAAIVFSSGLFLIIINGLTVYLASKLYHPLHITNFWAAAVAGMVIGLVNYVITTVLEDNRQ